MSIRVDTKLYDMKQVEFEKIYSNFKNAAWFNSQPGLRVSPFAIAKYE